MERAIGELDLAVAAAGLIAVRAQDPDRLVQCRAGVGGGAVGGADPMALLGHFSTAAIVCSLLFTVVGIYLFRYGKKQINYPIIFIAVTMMIYPMFTLSSGWFVNLGIGLGLCGAAYYYDQNHNLSG